METSNKHTPTHKAAGTPRVDTGVLECATDWMLRLEAAPDDPRLRCDLDAWLAADDRHRHAWHKVCDAWEMVGEIPVDTSRWPAKPARSRHRPALAGLAVAAMMLLAVLPSANRYWQSDYRTGVAEIRTLSLSDGTIATLGADSAIAEDFSDSGRRIRLLRGEVFLEVAEDQRPFLVQAGDLEARDIGTAFSVHEGGQLYSVAVSDGEVDVDYRNGDRHRLLAGDQLTIARDSGKARRFQVPADRVAAWREGRLFVQDRTVTDLADTLERYTSGYIVVADGDLAERRVTGSYDLSDVSGVLSAIVQPHGGRILHLPPFLHIVLGAN